MDKSDKEKGLTRVHITARVSAETKARIDAYSVASGISAGRVLDVIVAASGLTTGGAAHVASIAKERGESAADVLDEIIRTHHHMVTNMGPVRINGGYL